MIEVLINGRFLGQRVTGVQRHARELLKAMDVLLARKRQLFSVTILVPPGTECTLSLQAMAVREVGHFQGHIWEQVDLSRHAGTTLLLNLCNTGPVASRNMIAMIHDASVYDVPDAYSATFRLWYRTLLPLLSRRARRVVTSSAFSKGQLVRHAGVSSDRVVIIQGSGEHILAHASDERILERLALQPRRYVVAVGSHSKHKNLRGLAEAARLWGNGHTDIVVAGGSNSQVFSGGDHSIPAQMRFAGYVGDAELRALYENAVCLVFPSFYEGFGFPPLEAMSCCCPVVVSHTASLPEVCGEAAVYCDPANPADIARAVRQVITSQQLQDELRRRGAERAQQFSWRRAAQTMLNLVQDLSS